MVLVAVAVLVFVFFRKPLGGTAGCQSQVVLHLWNPYTSSWHCLSLGERRSAYHFRLALLLKGLDRFRVVELHLWLRVSHCLAPCDGGDELLVWAWWIPERLNWVILATAPLTDLQAVVYIASSAVRTLVLDGFHDGLLPVGQYLVEYHFIVLGPSPILLVQPVPSPVAAQLVLNRPFVL